MKIPRQVFKRLLKNEAVLEIMEDMEWHEVRKRWGKKCSDFAPRCPICMAWAFLQEHGFCPSFKNLNKYTVPFGIIDEHYRDGSLDYDALEIDWCAALASDGWELIPGKKWVWHHKAGDKLRASHPGEACFQLGWELNDLMDRFPLKVDI